MTPGSFYYDTSHTGVLRSSSEFILIRPNDDFIWYHHSLIFLKLELMFGDIGTLIVTSKSLKSFIISNKQDHIIDQSYVYN